MAYCIRTSSLQRNLYSLKSRNTPLSAFRSTTVHSLQNVNDLTCTRVYSILAISCIYTHYSITGFHSTCYKWNSFDHVLPTGCIIPVSFYSCNKVLSSRAANLSWQIIHDTARLNAQNSNIVAALAPANCQMLLVCKIDIMTFFYTLCIQLYRVSSRVF